jgi:membrane protein
MRELPELLQNLVKRAGALRYPVYFCWRFSQRWGNDRCPLMAAAMAFFGLLSVFPIVLAGVAILSQNLVGNPRSVESFKSYVASYFPGAASQIFEQINTIAGSTDTASVSILAIAALLWSGRAYFDTLAAVLNTIWPRSKPRSLVGHQLALWGTFAGAGLSFVMSSAVTVALAAAQSLAEKSHTLSAGNLQGFWTFAGRFSAWFLTLVMFWLMYRFLPNVQGKRRGRLALVAALVASLGWELAKLAFTGYIGNVHRFGQTYGTFAGIVLTMMWIYLSSLIILMAAEVAGAYEETRTLCRGDEPDPDGPLAPSAPPESSEMEDLPADQKIPVLVEPTESDSQAVEQRSK